MERAAARIFDRLQESEDRARLRTVSAEHPAILALPWELLHDPSSGGVFLFREISIRRRLAGAGGGRKPFKVQSKDRLHLLFVVSRPEGAGFLDPHADASAVLDALDEHAPGRCIWEFLRAPTLDALVARLDDRARPPIDILHFDGHGVFDPHGGLPERLADRKLDLAQVLAGSLLKDTPGKPSIESPPNTGYLLFETADGGGDPVSAEKLGLNLHRRRVPLVILPACQGAAQGQGDEPLPCSWTTRAVRRRTPSPWP